MWLSVAWGVLLEVASVLQQLRGQQEEAEPATCVTPALTLHEQQQHRHH